MVVVEMLFEPFYIVVVTETPCCGFVSLEPVCRPCGNLSALLLIDIKRDGDKLREVSMKDQP